MNNYEKHTVERIRAEYTEKPRNKVDELRDLDRKVSRPANLFAYIFGSISAVIMGSGMSLVMTEIGTKLGLENTLIPGILIGSIGLLLAIINYPIHQAILKSRKTKYADKILKLSDSILADNK